MSGVAPSLGFAALKGSAHSGLSDMAGMFEEIQESWKPKPPKWRS